jgi:hypothetical protein
MILVAVGSAASAGADDRSSLERQYAGLKKAYWNKDASRTLGYFNENFTWTKPMGEVVSRSEFAAELKRMLHAPRLRFEVLDMKNDSYDFTGDEARVRSSKHFVYTEWVDGRTVRVNLNMQTVDTWRRSPRGWGLYKVEVLNQTEDHGGS